CLILLFSGAVYYQSRLPLTGETTFAIGWIDRLRAGLGISLAEVLPEPQASLAQGIVLGIRSNIPPPVQANFVHTGTAHILAISGQNLSIVAGILVSFGIWLFGRRHYLYVWLALAVIWLYALLTGMQPPVVRGAIMASIFLIADLLGRQHSAFTALAFTGAIMVGVSPQVLGQASFQMSFMAMVGLIFIFPLFQSWGRKVVLDRLGESGIAVAAVNFVVDSLSVSLGAILAVWPLIAHYFGIISWVAPVATLFALPVLPGIIITGVLAGVVGLIVLPVAQVIAWLAWLFLSYMLLVVRVFSVVPFTRGIQIDSAFLWVYYSGLALIIWLTGKDVMLKLIERLKTGFEKSSSLFAKLPVKWLVPSLSVAAILVWITVFTVPDGNLHASFLDVGQGDASLFQRGSQQVLIDGGPTPEAITLGLGKEMPFWDRSIDLLILTHPHADHIAGLLEVLKRYQVNQVLYAGLDDKSPEYAEWLRLIREKNTNLTIAKAGQRITFGSGVVIEVLNPPTPFLTGIDSDEDNNGVVVRVGIGEVSFLITGDMQWEGEAELVTSRAELASTVLKVGHHGSATSTTDGFLGAVDPRLAVISVGKNNPYGHPTRQVLDRLTGRLRQENIYRTDESGTIDLITDGEKLWMRVEKK
ncbi:MAG: DNA internalization-related competence protein ComEC/Rec2, partial [Chloroflexi bacterium RBG_16_51_9]